jgi:hypothetical protein
LITIATSCNIWDFNCVLNDYDIGFWDERRLRIVSFDLNDVMIFQSWLLSSRVGLDWKCSRVFLIHWLDELNKVSKSKTVLWVKGLELFKRHNAMKRKTFIINQGSAKWGY